MRLDILKILEPYKDKVLTESALKELVDKLTPKTPEITHVIGQRGRHKLIVDGRHSSWANHDEIIRNGKVLAVTDVFSKVLPQVGILAELTHTEFKTTTDNSLE